MRIGIDYTAAVRQRGGIGRYTRSLVRTLSRLDAEREYTLFVTGGWGNGDGLGSWPSNFRVRSVPVPDRWLNILWQRLRIPLPVQAATGRIDLFHSPDFVLPPTGRTPTVLTVHDLSFLRVPSCYVPAFRRYLEGAVAQAVKRADRILADSESTRHDLIELMSVQPERVTVIYPGVDRRFHPIEDPDELQQVRDRYALPAKFILGLGTLQPRKNFAGLIEGFGRLVYTSSSWADPAECPELHLVVVGAQGWMYDNVYEAARSSGVVDRVHFVGFVADRDLPTLYNLAILFAFPTWYEGFGLPALEAMACGTPVVSADNSSLPEVVGNAALLIDAGNTDALAEAMGRLLANPELRRRLVSAGLERAKCFTWESAARQLLDVYASVCG